jgi:cytochrome P450
MRTMTPSAASKKAKTAPGLRQLIPVPFYGSVGWARRDPLDFLVKNRQRFGDVFRNQFGPWVYHLLSHPSHIQHVLQDNYKNYPRSRHYKFTKLVIGDGLVSTEGDAWRRQRRMIQPSFNHQRVAGLAGKMIEGVSEMLGRWEAGAIARGERFDVAEEMIRLTLSIVGKTLLGTELGGESDTIGPAVAEALRYLDHRINVPLAMPLGVPTPRNLRFRRAMRTLNEIVYRIIRERRAAGRDTGDLLAMLMSVRDEESGQGMSDREIRDQVMTFIGAGHETTAVALGWTWYLISRHPECEERLREEVGGALGGRAPTVSDLPKLAFTKRVVEESLRLYPPVVAVIRDVIDEDVIGGFHIPAGSGVILSQYVTQRHPEFWTEPDRFDPERFLPERSAGRPRFAWFPFLGGPHQCVGAEFAMMEMTLAIAMTMQRFRLRLHPSAKVEPHVTLSLRARYGIPMIAAPA